MANQRYLPTLSEDAWVISTLQQADYLFSHFLLADYSQTQLYLGSVSSLPWVLQEGQDDILKVITLLEDTLRKYFSRYYTNVEVEVTEKKELVETGKQALVIYVKFTDFENKEIILGKITEIVNMKVTNIININNG